LFISGAPRGAKKFKVEFCSKKALIPTFADRLGSLVSFKGIRPPFCFFRAYLAERIVFCMKKVAIIMGSDSDLPVVRKAVDVLREYDVPFEVHVLSAHRTPEQAKTFASLAAQNDFGVMIAAAGKAAHLAGAIAANTVLPVIGIPIKASVLDGMDALLSTVQMPAGIPVATVAIDGAANAALLAIQILALSEPDLTTKLLAARVKAAREVLEKDRQIGEEFSRRF